jgi:uncharacterized iron-regulated membrane protein
MASFAIARVRDVLWTAHRWIAIGLMVLLIPISVSGGLLVWRDAIDAAINPGRYAVTGADAALPAATYLANAAAVIGQGMQPTALRFPPEPGSPVTVTARGRAEGAPPRIVTAYLDPPTGRVLDVADFRASFVGILHRFHENLTVPEYSGRQVAGWVGVGMLILSLTGLWLWWPRNGAVLPGLRWRRSPATTMNLHHLIGFWISLPLAAVSATGIYLAFPQTARTAMSSVAAMSPQGQRPGAGQAVRNPSLTPDGALAAARASLPDALPAAIFLPTAAAGEAASVSWRVVLRSVQGADITVVVDDRLATVRRAPDPLAGDSAAQWIRWIHEGSHSGPVWRLVVFLCGIMPTALGVTGLVMWWRGRQRRKGGTRVEALPQFDAAE